MTEPVCSWCYRATLTPDQLQRQTQERNVTCEYVCAKHRPAFDELMARLAPLLRDARPISRDFMIKNTAFGGSE